MKKHIIIILVLFAGINLIFDFMDWMFIGLTDKGIEWEQNMWESLVFIGLGYLFGGLLNRVYKKDE